MAKTRAQHNRAIRQENLREWLSSKRLAEHVYEIVKKIEALEAHPIVDPETGEPYTTSQGNPVIVEPDFDLRKYKAAAELNLKLVSKYLPDVKQIEVEHNSERRRGIEDFSTAELAALLERSSDGAAETEAGNGELH